MKEKTRRVIEDMTVEIDRLKRMVASRDGLIHTSDAGLRATEANLVTMAARVDELTEEKEFLIRKNLDLTERANSACTRVDQLAKQCESLEAKRAELADQLLRLRTQVIKEGAEPSAEDRRLRHLEDENVELRQAQDAYIASNKLIAEGIDQRIKEAEKLTGLVSTLRDAIFAAAAGLDVVSTEEGDPSMLEVVAALGDAVREGKETDEELNEVVKVLTLVLWRLEGYTLGPQAFTADEVAETRTALKGQAIRAETSPIDGRVVVAFKPAEEAS